MKARCLCAASEERVGLKTRFHCAAFSMALIVLSSSVGARSEGPVAGTVVAGFSGTYMCGQGLTDLSLQILKLDDSGEFNAIFRFGPTAENPSTPTGAFLLHGTISLHGGTLDLAPVSWLSQPGGYTMVGLSGISRDGGNTFEGNITLGVGCTTFSIHRLGAETAATSVTSNAIFGSSDNQDEVPLVGEDGVLKVPVVINGTIALRFIIDSGATDVTIPADVVLVMLRSGTLNESDFLGTRTYRMANGATIPSTTFRIRSLKVGRHVLTNVLGSMTDASGDLLLGQSFLARFRSWSINNSKRVLVLK